MAGSNSFIAGSMNRVVIHSVFESFYERVHIGIHRHLDLLIQQATLSLKTYSSG